MVVFNQGDRKSSRRRRGRNAKLCPPRNGRLQEGKRRPYRHVVSTPRRSSSPFNERPKKNTANVKRLVKMDFGQFFRTWWTWNDVEIPRSRLISQLVRPHNNVLVPFASSSKSGFSIETLPKSSRVWSLFVLSLCFQNETQRKIVRSRTVQGSFLSEFPNDLVTAADELPGDV